MPQEKKLCFVISPIGNPDSDIRTHADWVLDGIIRPVMAHFPDFLVKRADNDARPGLIDTQMIDDLLNADLAIADLSFLNPNVFYEIGIRHMAQKPIIHMQIATEEPPFDVSLYRAIKFSRLKYRELESAKAELKRAVEAVLVADYQVENPITRARGRIQLEAHATPELKVLSNEIAGLRSRIESIDADKAANRRQAIVRALSERPSIKFTGGSDTIFPAESTIVVFKSPLMGFSQSDVETIQQALSNQFGLAVLIARGASEITVAIPGDIVTKDIKLPSDLSGLVDIVPFRPFKDPSP